MPDPSSMTLAHDSQYGRPLLIEEWSNRYFIHPLSATVERLAINWGVSANTVSFLGVGCGWLAGLFYYHQDHRIYILSGFIFMCLWHVFDGADGRIARATGTSSAFGRLLDGVCDHLVFLAVYLAFIFFGLKNGASPWIWGLAILAGLSHALQAVGYEERRQKYQRRLKGVKREQINNHLLNISGSSSWLVEKYDKCQRLVSGGESPLDPVIESYRSSSSPESENSAIGLVERTAKIVRAWALLNANNRTIMIAVIAILGRPELYFIYEIVILNIVFVGLIIYERLAENRITVLEFGKIGMSA